MIWMSGGAHICILAVADDTKHSLNYVLAGCF